MKGGTRMPETQVSLKTLADLQRDSASFTVDVYQRGFRWTRAEVRDLLDDVREFSLAHPEKDGAFFSSADSFSIIRGGHVDATVLGALQVSQEGDIANWIVPGGMVSGMGGAMDLVVGAKRVIVAMTHTQKGEPKIMKKCTLPLTAAKQVNMIITEMGVMDVTDKGLVLKEYNPEFTVDQIKEATDADLIIADDLKPMS